MQQRPLENKLWIINMAFQFNINDVQASDTSINFIRINFRGIQQSLEIAVGLNNQF